MKMLLLALLINTQVTDGDKKGISANKNIQLATCNIGFKSFHIKRYCARNSDMKKRISWV